VPEANAPPTEPNAAQSNIALSGATK